MEMGDGVFSVRLRRVEAPKHIDVIGNNSVKW